MIIAVTIILVILYFSLLIFYAYYWKRIPAFIPDFSAGKDEEPFISVIIAARNEEKNIGECLQSVLNQTLPGSRYEIIVINDHSTDRTAEIVQSFSRENVHLIQLEDFVNNEKLNSFKKKAIETGIHFSKGTLIVTTDADCIVSADWLETIIAFYKKNSPAFMAMPVVYKLPAKHYSFFKKFLFHFQSLDFMMLQGITGASVFKNFHSMCNGANLAYQKSIFYEVNGFAGIDKIASGDDMLLMHKIKTKYPACVFFLKSRNVIVQTNAAETFREFMQQRIRWASKSDQYSDWKITSVLILVYLLNLWIVILAVLSFFSSAIFYVFLFTLIIKIISELLLLFPVARFFERKRLLWWFVPSQPFHILYTVIAGLLGKAGGYSWKDRKVR